MSVETWFGRNYPKAAVVLSSFLIGILIYVWISIIYKFHFLIGILCSLIFYIVYGFLIYFLIYKDNEIKNSEIKK